MRQSFLPALVILILALAVCGKADDKFGYINSEQLRVEYKGAKDLDNQLAASIADWQAEAQEMEAGIEAMVGEFRSQSLLLSKEAAAERESAIEEKKREYSRFLSEVWGVDGGVARREVELWQPVIDRINEVIFAIGSEEGYVLIFDAAHMGIVYADAAIDLTQEVLDKLNEEIE